ncbi:MAG: hypothetical protein U0987_20705 [Afipia sp.]|nr:hypothetical protein [Afipia sp.]
MIELADNIVTVAVTTAIFAVLDTAALSPLHFLGQVFEEERVHRALKADMKRADLAFRERDDFHACELQPLIDGGDIFLIAGKAV